MLLTGTSTRRIARRDYRSFVKIKLEDRKDRALTAQPGPIQNKKGETIGEHKGVVTHFV